MIYTETDGTHYDKNMQLISTHTIKKSDLGFHGNLFGGKLLSWLDSSAAAYAMEICQNRRMVTLKIDECLFRRPAREGQLLKVYGKILKVGTTSVTLYLEARSYNVYTSDEDVILSTNIVFVRVDEEGNSIPISDKVRDILKKQI